MKYSVLLDSRFGQFIVNRHDVYYPLYILKDNEPPAAHQVDFLLDIIKQFSPGAVCLDIGAHIGHMTVPLAKQLANNNGTVYAFEIQRLVYYMLCGNIALNNLTNVHCIRKAAYNTITEINLPPIDYFTNNNFGGYTLKDQTEVAEQLETITIDGLNLSRIDLIKIDVEGLEEKVLEGAHNTLSGARPLLFIEYNLSSLSLINKIKSYGYKVFDYDGANCFCIHESSTINHQLSKLM